MDKLRSYEIGAIYKMLKHFVASCGAYRRMAIQYAEVSIVNARGGSAVGLSAYIDRGRGRDEFSGASYSFTHRGGLIDSGLVLPVGAAEWMSDANRLWNAATQAEYVRDRKTGELRLSEKGNPQVAKSYILALPKELTAEQNAALLRSYVAAKFSASDVAVQWAIHEDHGGSQNIHAHLLVSTRRIEDGKFGKKARELNPKFGFDKFRKAGRVSEGDRVGEEWRDFQNRYFRERGIDLEVDLIRIVPAVHTGASRSIDNSNRAKEQAARGERSRELARDPEKVVAHLTRSSATFSARQLGTFLRKSGLSEFEQEEVRAAIMRRPDLVRLDERDVLRDGRQVIRERYTLARIIEQEQSIKASAERLRARKGGDVSRRARDEARSRRELTDEQLTAFDAATGGEGVAVIQGRAGTGKSFTAGAIREAYEQDGWRVIGLAPTNTVAADMRADGFKEGRTLAAELMRQEHGRELWDERTAIIVDEMGMLSSNQTEQLLSHAVETGAKVIGFGDDRQLASVERGGMFGQVARAAEAVELTRVTRQREDWQRAASEAASRGDFKGAVAAYEERGAIRWRETLEAAYDEAKALWIDETAAGEAPFVYAATNDAVDRLNFELRQARIDLGQVRRDGERTFVTEKGDRRTETTVSVGDRIQFHATVKARAEGLELRNGEFGTILGIEGERIRVHLDGGRLVTFNGAERRGWGLGYAGTTYKGQGKTNRLTILLYDSPLGWSARGAYVNLTRHKERMQMVVPRELAANSDQLARQMSRDDGRKAATDYELAESVERVIGPRRRNEANDRQEAPLPLRTAAERLAAAEAARHARERSDVTERSAAERLNEAEKLAKERNRADRARGDWDMER